MIPPNAARSTSASPLARGSRRARRLRPATPRRRLYTGVGLVAGVGAPLGLFVLRAARDRVRSARLRWAGREVRRHLFDYAYLGLSTPLVFALFGRVLGTQVDRLTASRREVDRLRDEFAGFVAHGLRQPTQAILLFAENLLRHAPREAPAWWDATRKIRESSRRLAQMIDEIVHAERIETGRLTLALEDVDVASTLEATLRRWDGCWPDHPIRLELPSDLPRARLDVDCLDTALFHLLDNAAKFSPPGAPIVLAALPAPEGVAVSVRDTGRGLSRQEVTHLFDRERQIQRALERGTGLGLGLYIARGLVEAHGGSIRVERGTEGGTRITTFWPVRPQTGRQAA